MANLRDKGYPSAKSYKPNRSDKRNAVMDKNVTSSFTPTPQTEVRRKESAVHDAANKLVDAYTRKFFGSKMPRIHNIDYDSFDFGAPDTRSERGYAVRDYNNNRLGYASNSIDFDENGKPYAVYDVGIDNGNPNRGNLDIALNTPRGKFQGGFDQETNYATYQTAPEGSYGLHAFWADDRFEEPIEANINRGTSDVTGGNMYYADINYPFTEDRYKSFNTPLGELSMFTSAKSPFNEGYGAIEFDPNYYAQALANLLRGQF